jgi:hypothetical protein
MSEPRVPRVRQYHITLVLAGPEDSGAAWEAIRAAVEREWKVNDGARDSAGPGGTVLHGLFVKSGLLVKEAGREMLADELAWRHQYPLLGPNAGEAPRIVRRKTRSTIEDVPEASQIDLGRGVSPEAVRKAVQGEPTVIELRGGWPPETVRTAIEECDRQEGVER